MKTEDSAISSISNGEMQADRRRDLAVSALGVRVEFGGVVALGDVTVAVRAGECCGLVGPNGSGKSTLLNVLSGLTRVRHGQVLVGGRDITRTAPHELARMGIRRTFQIPRFDEQSMAIDAVLSGQRCRQFSRRRHAGAQAPRERAVALLDSLGAAEFTRWPVSKLSHGSRRKVEFARAVISEPSVLLLDEPTSGVSTAHGSLIAREIDRVSTTGAAVIVVDHDLEFVARVCTRVVVLNAGTVIYDGSVDGALRDPAVREAYLGE